jgi:hypothetical protein
MLLMLLLVWWASQAMVQPLMPRSAPAASPSNSSLGIVRAEPAPAASLPVSVPTAGQAVSDAPAGPPHSASEEETSSGVGSPPLHITYTAVGLDQAVLPLSPTEQEKRLRSVVPPPTLDAYWLTPYGVPGAGSTNTTYIIGHSWEGRPTPFNSISSRSKPGDRLTVTTDQGTLEYRVNEITTENKDTLKDSAIWAKVPGRLILITCYTEDLWGKNIIIQANPLAAE